MRGEVIDPLYYEHVITTRRETHAFVNATTADFERVIWEEGWEMYVNPAWMKEPNHVGDEFPGATFSGIPSPDGVGNNYAAHAAGYHLYMDGRMTFEVPDPRNVQVPPAGFSTGTAGWILRTSVENLPCQECPYERGLQPGILAGNVYVTLWKDVNLDKWPGTICHPQNPDHWDAENDVCRSDPRFAGYPTNFGWATEFPENIGVCGQTTLNRGGGQNTPGTGFLVRPAAGYTWEDSGAVLIRDYQRPSMVAWEPSRLQVLTGTEEVELELAQCGAANARTRENFDTYTIDAILFPSGSLNIGIETEIVGSMTRSVTDSGADVTIEPQTVRDVDVHYASLRGGCLAARGGGRGRRFFFTARGPQPRTIATREHFQCRMLALLSAGLVCRRRTSRRLGGSKQLVSYHVKRVIGQESSTRGRVEEVIRERAVRSSVRTLLRASHDDSQHVFLLQLCAAKHGQQHSSSHYVFGSRYCRDRCRRRSRPPRHLHNRKCPDIEYHYPRRLRQQ